MQIYDKPGVLANSDNFTLVKKMLKAGEEIPRHNHPEATVIFTVLVGQVQVTIENNEAVELCPGQILTFDGLNHIQAVALTDIEVQVALILKV